MSKCRGEAKGLACFTNAAGVPSTVESNSVYDAKGVLIALYYTDATGAVVDTSVGSVSPGACPVASPDVEWQKLCDVQSDGTAIPFMCRTITSFDASGDPIDPVRVDMFELDKVTAYVPSGDVGECDTCPDVTPLGLITDLSLLD